MRSEEFRGTSCRIIDKVIVTRSLAVLPLAGGRGTIACDGGRSYSRFALRNISHTKYISQHEVLYRTKYIASAGHKRVVLLLLFFSKSNAKPRPPCPLPMLTHRDDRLRITSIIFIIGATRPKIIHYSIFIIHYSLFIKKAPQFCGAFKIIC